jgi:spore maturation protein CgeB
VRGCCPDREPPALPDVFVPGEEVLDFSTLAGMVDRYRQALKDPNGLTSVGDAAARRAYADHTYEIRLQPIATEIGAVI